MKVQYYDNTGSDAEVSGQALKTFELADGKKMQVKFLFWWDTLKREFSTIDRGEITHKGVTLAYFFKSGNFMTWNLRESRDNARAFSEMVGDVFAELEKKIIKDQGRI